MSDATNSDQPTLAPVRPDERISSLDVLRGVALLGILLMNIIAFGLPLAAYGDPSTVGGAEGLNLYAWIVGNVCVEGTMRTIFSVLFGAGVILFTMRGKNEEQSVLIADLYYRRNLWLVAFGVVHAYLLLWIGEILYGYGITALFLFAFRKLGPKTLLVLGLLVLSVLVPKRILHKHEFEEAYHKYEEVLLFEEAGVDLTIAQQDTKAAWREIQKIYKPTEYDLEEEIASHQGDYLTNLVALAGINAIVQGEWYYLWNFWDILGMMLIGMALMKWDVLSAKRSYAFYATIGIIAYAVGITTNIIETKMVVESGFDLMVMQEVYVTYDLGRLAVATGHICLVMLFCKAQMGGLLKSALAATGRMALTNYIMHTLICVTIFSGFGFCLYGQLERYQLYFIVVAVWAVQLVLSPVWLRFFRFGPLEWLWRSLTYCKLQPLLHKPQIEVNLEREF